MKLIHLLAALAAITTATAQTAGQWGLQQKNSGPGFTTYWATAGNDYLFATDSSGVWTPIPKSAFLTPGSAAASYQPLDSDLTAIAALSTTTYGRSVLTAADAAALRTSLGLGTLATQSSITASQISNRSIGGNGAADAGHAAVFGGAGQLSASETFTVVGGSFNLQLRQLGTGTASIEFNTPSYTSTLATDAVTTGQNWSLPNASGFFALTGNSDGSIRFNNVGNVSTQRLLGRNSAGLGITEQLTASTVRTMLSLNAVENTALSTWTGSTSLATLGTVTTGTWNATPIGVALGGTGVNSSTLGSILFGSGTNTRSSLAGNTSATMAVLTQTGTGSASAAPEWTTTTGTGGAIVRATNPTITGATLNAPILTAQTMADVSVLNVSGGRPPCVMFDDFLGNVAQGAHPWADSGTGSTDTGASGGSGLFAGICRLVTGTASGNFRSRSLSIGATNIANGAVWRCCFAIPTVTEATVFVGGAGGGGSYGLLYDHGANGNQWVLATSGTVTTFTAATPEAGNFLSGRRYQVTLQRVSNTSCTMLLEIADWNASNWSTVFNGTITHASHSPDWGVASPTFSVTTKTTAARSIIVDWFSLHHTGITR